MREACYTKALTIAFTERTYENIKEITDEKKISMGEWVRIAAEKALATEEYIRLMERRNNDDEQ